MTRIDWATAVSGNFNTAADWTGGVVPGELDDAVLDASGAAFTVTASGGQVVGGIRTAANAILEMTSDFIAVAGTDGGVNAGEIVVSDNNTTGSDASPAGPEAGCAVELTGAGQAVPIALAFASFAHCASELVSCTSSWPNENKDSTSSDSQAGGAHGGTGMTLVEGAVKAMAADHLTRSLPPPRSLPASHGRAVARRACLDPRGRRAAVPWPRFVPDSTQSRI